MIRYRFPKTSRVVRAKDFQLAIRQGSCAADGTLVVFAVASSHPDSPRIGITIPKKTGNAPTRNRWKRLIRESFRTQQEQIPTGYDFVVRPKKDAKPDWHTIEASLPRLCQKAVQRLHSKGS